ncbi:MAG TPA: translesion error-prone DNA polymerase V autoproteolytic subunit [Rubricoccaceae bacterium]|jgi:DNA polymerase V
MFAPPVVILGSPARNAHPRIPLVLSRVRAGLPTPADSDIDALVDLGQLLGTNSSSYLVRVEGDSMRDAGISSGDTLVVDRQCEPREGQIVIASLGGDLTVKRVQRREGRILLAPCNDAFDDIEPSDEDDVVLWGVVTHVIHDVRRPEES